MAEDGALEPFGDDIWIAAGPDVVSASFRYPTRMALMRLVDGGLFIWSPVALSPALRTAIDALGEVRFVVTPTAMHYLALPEWREAYPRAWLYGAPGARERAKHIAFDDTLSDMAPVAWASDLDQVLVRGNAIATEAVFFHRKSGTALFADLLQNFPRGWFTGWRALIAGMDGMIADESRTPQKFRMAFTDRRAARASMARILAWPSQQVLMAHGTPVRADGQAYLRRAFSWL